MKFNSSRCDEKLRGSVKPFLSETRLKVVVNAGERSSLLIFSGGIYIDQDQRTQMIVVNQKVYRYIGRNAQFSR